MKAIFAGTFDPFTLGHKDITERAAHVFGDVVVAVAEDTGKNSMPLDIRLKIAEQAIRGIKGASVTPFKGLLSEFAKGQGECVLVRGIRNSRDMEYEREHARIYRSLCGAGSMCFMTAAAYEHVSSTAVRELAALGGELSGYVAPNTEDIIKKTYAVRNKGEL